MTAAAGAASRLLVVAGSAAESDELLQTLVERSEREPVELTLIVPASADAVGPHTERAVAADAAERRLRAVLARFRAAGLYVRESGVGEGGPVLAVADAVASGRVDEIVVATPVRGRRRAAAGSAFSERLRVATGLPVTHVSGSPPARPPAAAAPRRSRGRASISPRARAVRVLAAVGLALLALAAGSAAIGDQPPAGRGAASPALPAPAR